MAKKKKKSRNQATRKPRAFAHLISHYCSVATLSLDELLALQKEQGIPPQIDEQGNVTIAADQLPAGSKYIETLQGNWVFSEERCNQFKGTFEGLLWEFGEEFWSETGASLIDLRRDRKNRVWGTDLEVQHLAYMAIACGLAKWTYEDRKVWAKLKEGLPFIKFTCAPRPKNSTLGDNTRDTIHTNKEDDTKENADNGSGSIGGNIEVAGHDSTGAIGDFRVSEPGSGSSGTSVETSPQA